MKISSTVFKIIACITMAIDHVGHYLFPELTILRVIGRFAFPVYAYCVAQGVEWTHDKKRYLLRMFFFACLTQLILHSLNEDYVNVLFTYSFAIFGLMMYDRKLYPLMLLPIAAAYYFDTDYSYYGILFVYILYCFKNKHSLKYFLLFLTTIFFILEFYLHFDMVTINSIKKYWMYLGEYLVRINLQFLAILVVMLLDKFYDFQKKSYSNKLQALVVKYSFYLFYPLHLAIILLIKGVN